MTPEEALSAYHSRIRSQLDANAELPCPVSDMTERELAIFKIAASHAGFLRAFADAISPRR